MLFRPKIIVIALAFFSLSATAIAQDESPPKKVDWHQEIVGTWKMDIAATEKIWNSTGLKDSVESLRMLPLAPAKLDFSLDKVGFEHVPNRFGFQLKEVDLNKKTFLLLELFQADRLSTLQFQVLGPDTLVLDVPASVFGPIEIVYQRQAANPLGMADNPLLRLEGEWKFNESLSKSMWEKLVPAASLETYSLDTLQQIKKFASIRFDHTTVYYDGDQTAELVGVAASNNRTILLRTTLHEANGIEVNIISGDLIQVGDGRRRLLAIYERNKPQLSTELPLRKRFPTNNIAQSFLRGYLLEKREPLDDRSEAIGIDGAIEVNELAIERRRAADAVVNADITNMHISLFIDVQSPNHHHNGGFLVRMNDLQAINDNTGKLLSTDARRKDIDMLRVPVLANEFHNKRDGRSGPSVSFRLDAPALGATEIEQLTGEIEVFKFTSRFIKFENLHGLVGSQLQHALLDGLDIRPGIKSGPDDPRVTLTGNDEVQNRILSWHVIKENGEVMTPSSHGGYEDKIAMGFSERIPQNVALWLEVVDMEPGRKFPFNFRGIKFP